VINLREASEPGANIEENAAKAKALGLNYIHIPFNGQAPQTKTVDDFLRRSRTRPTSRSTSTADPPIASARCGS
jgi:protein tyrosine phosphatase (PTP) superfamily phosphohydrolase (DUF442 family)